MLHIMVLHLVVALKVTMLCEKVQVPHCLHRRHCRLQLPCHAFRQHVVRELLQSLCSSDNYTSAAQKTSKIIHFN